MYLNKDMDGGPFLVYFLPILGGQNAAMSDSVKGWCAAGNLEASKVSIRKDDQTDGQMDDRMDDWMDSGEASFHPDILYNIRYMATNPYGNG